MRFWDTSALLPLLVQEPRTDAMVVLLRDDPAAAVWWLTPVECWSVLARRWTEVSPLERVREQAARLLRFHPLRAAEALQLEEPNREIPSSRVYL